MKTAPPTSRVGGDAVSLGCGDNDTSSLTVPAASNQALLTPLDGAARIMGGPFDELFQHHYSAIQADVAWRFLTRDRQTAVRRGAVKHYRTMPIAEIRALPVVDLAAHDCALFLWAISPMLPAAIELIDHWGFEFKTIAFVWGKLTKLGKPAMGPGYWCRCGAELCLLATRGHPKRLDRSVRQLILEPRREHSRKPDRIAGDIERLVAGPYIELFARTRRPNWTVWGDQLDKFNGE